MASLKRLLARRHPSNQQQTAGRAAEVIEKVIFDVGVETLVNGTLLLDRRFQPRFVGLMPVPRKGVIAAVTVGQVPEAALLRAQVGAALRGPAAPACIVPGRMALPVGGLVDGLMREFKAQSPAFRALP
ncbi:MAG TPA: hypothetical protein VF861_16195 [Telluria sp.]